MVEIEFKPQELQRFMKRVEHCRRFGDKNKKMIVKLNRQVARIYVKAARSAIVNSSGVFKVYRNGEVRMEVQPGTLKRSMGAWRSGRGSNVILAGPRAGRKAGGENRDGWFAAIVEGGHAGTSQSHATKNKGVFTRTLRANMQAMRMKRDAEYRKEFKRYVR